MKVCAQWNSTRNDDEFPFKRNKAVGIWSINYRLQIHPWRWWDSVSFKCKVYFLTSYCQVVDFLEITESEKGLTGFKGEFHQIVECGFVLPVTSSKNIFMQKGYQKLVQLQTFVLLFSYFPLVTGYRNFHIRFTNCSITFPLGCLILSYIRFRLNYIELWIIELQSGP